MTFVISYLYSVYPKYSGRQVCKNREDPDQMPHSVASDQCLHCLQLINFNIKFNKKSDGPVQIFGEVWS